MSVLISRRKQRPSSASAALQSHGNYQQVTINDMRPATSISTARSHRSHGRNYQSPVTSKTRTQHNNTINGWTSIAPLETNSRTQRRVTLSALNDVSRSTGTISRPRSAASSKIKVQLQLIVHYFKCLLSHIEYNNLVIYLRSIYQSC